MGVYQQLMHPALVWFVIGLILFFLEMAAPAHVIIFFGIGAWIVAVLCLVTTISLNMQLIIFILASGIVLLFLRSWFKTLFHGYSKGVQNPMMDLDDFIGKKAFVKETIVPRRSGKVEFNGTLWGADADQEIGIGETVQVVGKDNLTLKVKKV